MSEILQKLSDEFINLAESYENHQLYPSFCMQAIAETFRKAADIVKGKYGGGVMKEKGICPLSIASNDSLEPCHEEGCAWWVGDACAIAALGKWAKAQEEEIESINIRLDRRGDRENLGN